MIGSTVSIQVLAGRALNSIPEGLAVALLAWVVLRLVGRQNSGTRFAVWFLALLAIAFIPFIPAEHLRQPLPAVHPEITLPASWAGAVLALWALVAFFGIARLAFGVARLATLRRNSVVIDPAELAPAVQQAVTNCQALRGFELRVSSEIRVPTAIGFFRPVILIPAWALDELPSEQLGTVILHEFAHLQRRDDWTNFAQKLVRALLFFHPAVLWVDRRLSLEREMACDDVVLEATRNPQAYATCLVALAEKSFVRRTVALAQAAISRAQETSVRIAQILDGDRPAATRIFKPLLAGVAGLVALGFALVPYGPRLVAFQDPVSIGAAEATAANAPDIPKLPHSMIVPAMARVESHATPAKPAALKSAMQKSLRPHRTVTPLYARAALRKPRPAPQEQYLVVSERTDYYRHGDAVVGVSVWSVTLVSAPVKFAHSLERPKQT